MTEKKSAFQCDSLDCDNPVTKWEYMLIDDATSGCNPDGYQDLNFLGSKGWELVSIRKNAITGGHVWYFKRQISLISN